MERRIVVVSGLPGSGKSTLARQLAEALNFALIDKDTILQRLFESKGTGDAAWRRHLDDEKSYDEVLAGFREIARLGSLEIGQRIKVDTSREPNLGAVGRKIRAVFKLLPRRTRT